MPNHFSENDSQKTIIDWNKTSRDYPSHKTVIQLFEEQVIKTPEKIALVFKNHRLTYLALNEAANQLARTIEQHAINLETRITPDTLIALSFDRSFDMFIAILAILKTGAAYLPIDPNTPKDRLHFLLEDSKAPLLLTQQNKQGALLQCLPKRTQLLVLDSVDYHHENKANLEKPISPQHLIYVIYTSGTTGKPKGVMISHQNVVNYYANVSPYFKNCEHIDFSSSLAFDLSVTTTLIPLLSGKKIIIYPGDLRDTENYISHLQNGHIDFIKSTPSFLTQVFSLPQFTQIKTCFVGGEKLQALQLETLLKHCDTVYDEYGPTESTVGAFLIQKTYENPSNGLIGKPYYNQTAYVLDDTHQPVKIGIIGELYLGGAGISRGYLNQPTLTKERFIPNPFSSHDQTLYKTGDLVKWLPDGNLEYIGRNDFQVKINGYRIELNEIESALSNCKDIIQNIALIHKNKLFAYYLSENSIDETSLLSTLQAWLPAYMLPHHLIHLKKFPLTINGKIDREKLCQYDISLSNEAYIAPRNFLEERLCAIWQEVLNLEKIGITEDFFKLGGDSIGCMQVMALLLREGIQCRVKDIYDHRCILELSSALGKKCVTQTEPGLLTGDMALLPVQSWFFEQNFPNINHWNQSFLVRVPLLSIEKLNTILPLLVEHHDVLRVSFPKNKAGSRRAHYGVRNCNIHLKKIKIAFDDIFTEWQSTFDIENGPLWQIAYIENDDDKDARLYFAFHHLIMDSVSWRILVNDLYRLYKGDSLGSKGSSYRQWVNTIDQYAKKNRVSDDFWKNSHDDSTFLPPLLTTECHSTFTLTKKITQALIGPANSAYHTEINDLLLTALSLALSAYFEKEKHLITLEGHGREEIDPTIDITNTVGWFTSLFPVLLETKNSLSETLVFLKESIRAIPHKGIGYGAFKYANGGNAALSNLPKIIFNYLGQFDSASSHWQISETFVGKTIHDNNKKPHVFDIIGAVINKSLKITISSYLPLAACNIFSTLFEKQLTTVINHCTDQIKNKQHLFTPSDFNSVKITPDLLKKLQLKDNAIEAIYPANSLQQGFIYHAITQPESDAYRVQLLLDYYISLNIEYYKMAWNAIIAKHPILRTYFNADESLLQITSQQSSLNFQLHDFTKIKDQEKKLSELQIQDRALPFDLEKPSLIRLHLIQLSESHFVLIKNTHHSILDGWSLSILINQVHRHYLDLIHKKSPEIIVDKTYLKVQHYIAENASNVTAFWENQLKDSHQANDIQFLLDHKIDLQKLKAVKKSGQTTIVENSKIYHTLKQCSQKTGLTINIFVQYSWHKLIKTYTQDDRTLVGTTLSGRNIPISGIDESIGLYINTLPVVIAWDNENTIIQQLHKLASDLVEVSEHGFIPLANLQKNGERLFHTLIISEYDAHFDNHDALPFCSRGTIESLDYPLVLIVKENDTALTLKLKYDTSLLSDNTAEALLLTLQRILEQLPDNIQLAHTAIKMLSATDYQKIIYDWNATKTAYPHDKTVDQLFEDQALKTPDAIALVLNDNKLSYQSLNEKANQLARFIQSQTSDTIIPIFFDYSFEMVIALLAVLKSGAAYVPIDTTYPKNRIISILKDINSSCVLTSTDCVAPLQEIISTKTRLIALNTDSYQNQKKENLHLTRRAHDLAYIIYTSGTTGLPKGVMVSHQNVSNYLLSITTNEAYAKGTIVDCSSSIAFDATVAVLLAPLISGRAVVLLSPDNKRDTHLYLDHIKNNAIDLVRMTPSFLSALLLTQEQSKLKAAFSKVSCLIVGGEKANLADIKTWMHIIPTSRVINHYGPTETTVACGFFNIDNQDQLNALDALPLGRAAHNHQFYVLDSALNPVPVGAIGELYVGGAGVSKGYFNQAHLTQEKFINNPFLNNTLLYKTGDLVRYLPDGNLHYIGRNDFQVKIRGYRIELGEVEKIISNFEEIQQCVVTAIDEKLAAYYISKTTIDTALLKSTLEAYLPHYMIPSAFIKLGDFPLTPHGKLDRRALPKPKWIDNTIDYTPPRDELESLLCTLWENILDVRPIGIHDDFFKLGGNSISAIHLTHRICQQTNQHLSPTDLFKHKTILEVKNLLLSGNALEKITPISGNKAYLSFAQEQLWFIEQYEGGTDAFHIPLILKLDQSINIKRLENALKAIVMRHEVLRTLFYQDTQGMYQQDIKNGPITIFHKKINQSVFSLERQKFLETYFDLTKDYPIRIAVFNIMDNDSKFLMIIFHHVAFDAWSKNIFLSELAHFYHQKEILLLPLTIHYKDFSMWQRDHIAKNRTSLIDYWKKTLQTCENLSFPTDYQRPAIIDYSGDTVNFQLPDIISNQLKKIAVREGVTLYTILLTAFSLLLSKYTGQNDILIGSPTANRQHTQLSGLIGFFVNLLPLRIQLVPDNTFKETLKGVQNALIEAHCHQDLPFSNLIEHLAIEREASRHPLFQLLFNLDYNNTENTMDLPWETMQGENDYRRSKLDLSVSIQDKNNCLHITLQYATCLFKRESIVRFANYYAHILEAITGSIDLKIKSYSLLNKKDYQKIVYDWNNTEQDFPTHKTMHQLFEEQAAKTPEKIALVFNNEEMTYQTLNEKSNQLANLIIKKHGGTLKPDTLIAFCLNRSNDMIITLFAILKAGAAYVPIEPHAPADRMIHILKDTKCALLLTQKDCLPIIKDLCPTRINLLIVDAQDYTQASKNNLTTQTQAKNLAYIIYTSGTTGLPKGVMVPHEGIVNIVYHIPKKLFLTEESRVLQFASISFDAAALQIFNPLSMGATLYIASENTRKDANALAHFLKHHKITYAGLPPVLLAHLNPNDYPDLKTLVVAGESSNEEQMKRWRPSRKLINAYGPTENTIGASLHHYELTDSNRNIGKPLPNVKAYILDSQLMPVAIGIVGELYLGGSGVARGYLNNTQLTHERFIPNPFSSGRLYKTGDLVRWLPDGNIAFIGRNDFQVKLRGYRIELSEIENAILSFGDIQQCLVIVREEKIIAYFIEKSNINQAQLRNHLEKKLPYYMLPSAFVLLDHFPLSTNGKIDNKSLPDPIETAHAIDYVAPRNELETLLCTLWQESLKIVQVGIDDDFFKLGGHSILAAHLAHKMSQATHQEIAIADIFKQKTIRQLSLVFSTKKMLTQIEATEKQYAPLSFAQERLWFIEQYECGTDAYHIPLVLQLEKSINISALKNSLQKIIHRHEILRTVFIQDDKNACQQVVKEDSLTIHTKKINEIDFLVEKESFYHQHFNLEKQYPIRACLFTLAETNSLYLMLVFHHIAFDAWSKNIFISELTHYYNDTINNHRAPLAPLVIQYNDFSIWQRHTMEKHIDTLMLYWKTKLNDYELLAFPTDYARPAIMDYRGDIVTATLSEDLIDQLNTLANTHKTSLFTILLTGFSILLSKYTGQSDLLIGTPIINREHPSLNNLIGLFVNSLVLRVQIAPSDTTNHLIESIQKTIIEAQQYQDLPFEQLINGLNITRDTARHPLFQVLFTVFENTENSHLETPWKTIEFHGKNQTAKFDLAISIQTVKKSAKISIQYATSLFKKDTIERFITHYSNILNALFEHTNQSIASYSPLSNSESNLIIQTWNDTHKPYFFEKTIHTLFETQAQKTPNKIALVFEKESLTYRELDEKSNQLAHYIRAYYNNALTPETIIGLCVERSLDTVIGILGILKSGAAYVPIDPSYPKDRIAYMINDTNCQLVFTHEKLRCLFDCLKKNAVISLDMKAYMSCNTATLPAINKSSDLAYVMYTSGTTGVPKGVMIEHRSVICLLQSQLVKQSKTEIKGTLWTNIIFDVSVYEIFSLLLTGGALHILTDDVRLDAKKLFQTLLDNQITTFYLPPFFVEKISNALLKLKEPVSIQSVLLSVEPIQVQHLSGFISKNIAITNAYGPTETTVFSTAYFVEDISHITGKRLPIGRALHNELSYILDENLSPVPIGVIGELYLGGDGLARGYLNKPALTAEKFISNPFIPHSKMYKTGDLVRYLSDGNIEYIGRRDFQVKIHGVRIELGEIEQILITYSGIDHSVVLAHDKKLIAYYTGFKIEENVLRRFMSEKLPDTMLPTAFIHIEKLPLHANGKLNRNALPLPIIADHESAYIAPRNATDEKIRLVWQEILSNQNIQITDDFFTLGGDSIASIQVISKLRYEGIYCAIKDIFQYRTIERLTDHILEKTTASVINAEQGILEGSFDLLPTQAWFFEQQFQYQNHWNQAFLIRVPELSVSHLQSALEILINRHDMLRISFEKNKSGNWQQHYAPSLEKTIEKLSLNEDLLEKLNHLQSSLNITTGPLWKIAYIDGYHNNSARLFFVAHHLMIDTVSWKIIINDLKKLYDNAPLNLKTSSYRQWQHAILNYATTYQDEINFWKTKIDSPSINCEKGVHTAQFLTFSEEITQSLLKESNAAYHSKTEELLLTALAYALEKITHQTASTVTLESYGRELPDETLDVSETIGWFTSFYPINLQVKNNVSETIQHIKDHCRDIPNKGIGYSALLGTKNLPPVYFNYLGQSNSSGENWSLISEPVGSSIHSDNCYDFLILINAHIANGKLTIKFGLQLSKENSDCFVKTFETMLIEIAQHCLEKTHKNQFTYTSGDFKKIKAESDLSHLPLHHDSDAHYLPFEMTPIQKAYAVGRLKQFEIGNVANHIYTEFYFNKIDEKKLEKALNQLIKNYAETRTVFDVNHLMQRYLPFNDSLYYTITVDQYDMPYHENALATLRNELTHVVYDISTYPLFHFRLSRFEDTDILHTSFDLLLLDAQTRTKFFMALTALYHEEKTILPKPGITFRDYQVYMGMVKTSLWYENDKKYWKEKRDTLPLRPKLPLNCDPNAIEKPHFKLNKRSIAPHIWQKFKKNAEKNNVSYASVLLSLYGYVLSRFSETPDFLITMTLFNRYSIHKDINQLWGDFTSTNLFGFSRKSGSAKDFFTFTHDRLWDDIAHALYTGLDVQRDLMNLHQLEPTIAVSPIVFTCVIGDKKNRSDTPDYFISPDEQKDKRYWIGQTSQAWIDLQATERDGTFSSGWLYVSQLFSDDFIDSLNRAYCDLINYLAEHEWDTSLPSVALSDAQLSLITAANTTQEQTISATLVQLFENQSKKQPHASAIIDKNGTFSYSDLQKKCDAISYYLDEYITTSDSLIAILCEKSFNQVAATLGIMKAGAAYLPLNIEWPIGRINDILIEGNVTHLLVSEAQWHVIKNTTLIKNYQVHRLEHIKAHGESIIKNIDPNNPAYVIFTSGSTGKPKGVCISHKGAVNTILAVNHQFKIDQSDAILALSELSFDLSVYDLFGLLGAGGVIVFPDQSLIKEPTHWIRLIEKHKITLWNTVPQLMQLLLDNADIIHAPLRLVLLSGDWVPVSLAEQVKSLPSKPVVFSLGGATEASIWSIWYEISKTTQLSAIPYGFPMPNQNVYILNAFLEHCAIGMAGDIYLGGEGLALNYWRDIEKTKARFIDHHTLGRLYKTGDLGKWSQSGYVEFLGREDNQVKRNGNRIELDEIAAKLIQLKGIDHALVRMHEDRLIAYLVSMDFKSKQDNGFNLEQFKLEQHGLRKNLKNNYVLVHHQSDDNDYRAHKSYRQFSSEPLLDDYIFPTKIKNNKQMAEKFNQANDLYLLLSVLSAKKLNDKVLPKYLYPSAGSLYAIQCYLHIPDAIENIAPGYYYYHPVLQALQKVENHPINRDLSLELRVNQYAIETCYGKDWQRLAHLECGHMLYLLTKALEKNNHGYALNMHKNNDDILASLKLNTHTNRSLFSKKLKMMLLNKASESLFEKDDRCFDLNAQSLFMQTSELGHIIHAAQKLLIFEGENNSTDWINAGYHAQQHMNHWTALALGYCPLGLRPYHEGIYTIALGMIPKEEIARAETHAAGPAFSDVLTKALSQHLPCYMLPQVFITLEQLPLTANGKIDFQALPLPNFDSQHERYTPPRTDIETTLCHVWQEVLGLTVISITDDFFRIGGDSILSIHVTTKLRQLGITCDVLSIFEYRTIEKLAPHIKTEILDEIAIDETYNDFETDISDELLEKLQLRYQT